MSQIIVPLRQVRLKKVRTHCTVETIHTCETLLPIHHLSAEPSCHQTLMTRSMSSYWIPL